MKNKYIPTAAGLYLNYPINGLGMMLWQGARAFEIWTGKEMPVEHIKSILF